MWYVILTTVGSLLAYVTYQAKYDTHGWYGKVSESVNRKRCKLRRASQMLQAFNNGLEALKAPNFSINDTGCSASITYNHVGKSYLVNVPFKSSLTNAMMPLRAVLHKLLNDKKTVKEIDITQEPGIPYMVCAGDLGGSKIVISNSFTGQSMTFETFESPGYVYKLHYSE